MKLSPADPVVLKTLRREHHARCFIGRPETSFGLGVEYRVTDDGGVEATVECPDSWEGYAGLVHGGIIAALLDGAMTNALFARGIVALTADMDIRFRESLELGRTARVSADVEPFWPRVYKATARIEQEGLECASCTGTFMVR